VIGEVLYKAYEGFRSEFTLNRDNNMTKWCVKTLHYDTDMTDVVVFDDYHSAKVFYDALVAVDNISETEAENV